MELLPTIGAKKKRLDELRALSPKALVNLEHYYNIELTYTSNAIEGNALSPVETTLVIEQGITVSGRSKIIWRHSTITTRSAMCASSRGTARR